MKKVFGQELRKLRSLAGLTMRDLASEIDCSIVYISDIERSKRNPPSTSQIQKLVCKLGCPNELPRMLRLAAEARQSIEFKVDDSRHPEEIVLLLAFKRRIDQRSLTLMDVEKIKEILDADLEREM